MVDSPVEAGVPRTSGATRSYEGDGIVVDWWAERCIHTANCLRALPAVFDTASRPWVDITAADPEEIAAAVRTCPTGALRYSGDEMAPDDGAGEPVAIEAQPDGPLYVRGPVRITDYEDQPITDEPRVALCRCGASENKPFCDNSHRHIGWVEGGTAQS